MEEFDIREATPEDAEKIIAYLAQVGGETDYLSFGKEGLPISTAEEEKFIQNMKEEEHSVLYVVYYIFSYVHNSSGNLPHSLTSFVSGIANISSLFGLVIATYANRISS